MKSVIDQIDRLILKELQKDARITITELSQKVNLSSPAVIRRIKTLEDAKVILGYRAILDPAQMGFPVRGYIIVSVQKLELKKFLQYIEPLEEVISCETIVAGGKELIMQVVCRDNEHLMELYDKLPYNYIEDMTALITMSKPDKSTGIPC